jgi:betaine lipid synthase
MSSVASGPAGFLLSGFDRHYASIAGAAFFVCALVAVVLIVASQKRNKVDNNSGIFIYLRFIYASFLKPHDKGGSGQQDALESFYSTQV